MSARGGPLKVFISYSHRDDSWREQLEAHLSLLRRQGILELWSDRRLIAGDSWDQEISSALAEARILLLLVSPDFIASDYCFGREMAVALERHQRGEAKVVPILLRPCDWTTAPFAHCQAFPRDNRPVSTHPAGADAALSEVARELRRLADQWPAATTATATATATAAAAPPAGNLNHRRWPWRLLLPLGALTISAGALVLHGLSQLQSQEGLAMVRLGAYPRAAAAFRNAGLLFPLDPLARCGGAAAAVGDRLNRDGAADPALPAAIAALPTTGPCGGQRQLFDGDLAMERHLANRDPADWLTAQAAYSRALELDKALAEAEQRLGSMADASGDPQTAQAHFERALKLSQRYAALASPYRNGLAKVLLQGDGAQRQRALALFDGDRGNPASDVEAAMQRWPLNSTNESLGLALERLPAVPPPVLRGDGLGQAWGFRLSNGDLVLMQRRSDQRCLLAQARATTLHLLGRNLDAEALRQSLETSCSDSQQTITTLLCDRLRQAATNPRAPRTARWLACPASAPASSAPPQPGSTG
ncbi:toll/interleukin-1 receptor domain-containing protein [Cyanobium sp. FGCU-6]|nr:toll/interleukin-1 receptor domain-containing protein [Cyanobium sp. FGCU6]